MWDLKDGVRGSSEHSVLSPCFGVRCRCPPLSAWLTSLAESLGHPHQAGLRDLYLGVWITK